MHARVAHVYAELTGSDLRVRSLVDSDPDVEICFAFPPTMAPSASEGLAIAASLGILVGSVSYAHSIALHFAVPDNELRLLRRLCGLLYDVRAALEHFDFVEPQISALPGHRSSPSFSLAARENRGAVVLWGGGKDSLYSQMLLQANGYKTVLLHAEDANPRCADHESVAARALADRLLLPLMALRVDWSSMIAFAKRYSDRFDAFPLHNAVPHGRDVPLALAAAVIARHTGNSYVCAGHERDLWTKRILYRGRTIHRHDAQSEMAGVLLDELVQSSSGCYFFSPICRHHGIPHSEEPFPQFTNSR